MGTGADRIDFNSATLAELFQVMGGFPRTIPVTLDGPVRSQTLPTRGGATRNLRTDSTVDQKPSRIAGGVPQRARLQVWCTGVPVYIGFDEASVRAGEAAILPVGQVFETSCVDPMWVLSTAGEAEVSYAAENWAD